METMTLRLWSKQAQYQYSAEAYRPKGKIIRSEAPDRIES